MACEMPYTGRTVIGPVGSPTRIVGLGEMFGSTGPDSRKLVPNVRQTSRLAYEDSDFPGSNGNVLRMKIVSEAWGKDKFERICKAATVVPQRCPRKAAQLSFRQNQQPMIITRQLQGWNQPGAYSAEDFLFIGHIA